MSQTTSVVSISSDEDDEDATIYNAVLVRKEGWIVAKQVSKRLKAPCIARILTIAVTTSAQDRRNFTSNAGNAEGSISDTN